MKRLGTRSSLLARISAALLIVGLWLFFSSSDLSYSKPTDSVKTQTTKSSVKDVGQGTAGKLVDSIMPSMPDQEAKEMLGRASWKYFHTLLARFPDEPTEAEQEKLKSFLYLYAELYPCGECSYHFVKMLQQSPPQVASRKTAAVWGCHMHNKVNEYLGKEEYDCTKILEDYDCGCGDEDGNIKNDLKLKDTMTMEVEGKQGG